MLRKILENACITKKCTQCKTSHTLKTDVFELPDNENIGKLFSKYELFSLDQANLISDPSQILILQYPFPTAYLPSLSPPSIFPLVNWNPSSAQSSSCSSSISPFFLTPFDHTPQLLDITNHIPSNQIYYEAIHKS